MSDNIPFDIQGEILKWLPVKSLIQFRSVSKEWKSHIDSSRFIAGYRSCVQHLLVKRKCFAKLKYVSLVDDDTFSQPEVTATAPHFPNSPFFSDYRLVGCSHGLLCLYGGSLKRYGGLEVGSGLAVIWNPSIKKAVAVYMPYAQNYASNTFLGFGVSGESMDPKIVKISKFYVWSDMESTSPVTWQVDVFTLSTGVWRSSFSNLPRKSIKLGRKWVDVEGCVDVDGFLYWLAYDEITVDDKNKTSRLIISFDLETEEFGEVNLPDCLAEAYNNNHYTEISKLRNSLVVIDYDKCTMNNPVYVVWMMEEDGVPKSFTKLYTLHLNTRHACIRGFRMSGAPIVDTPVDDDETQLVVYEPKSKHIDNYGYNRKEYAIALYPYMKTLLLLDQPYLKVYNDISIKRMERADNKSLSKDLT